MVYLKTLEGVETSSGSDVNDLFDTNDTLGCLLYGPRMWNQIKSYACNRALELLANKSDFGANLSKIANRKNYIARNDILDRAFGFNHRLGVELYGVEEWDDFVRDCKTSTPEMGSVWGAIKSVFKPKGTLYPENWTPGGIVQWVLAPGLTNISDAFAEIGSKTSTQKAAEDDAAASRATANEAINYANQVNQAATERIEQAKKAYDIEYSRTKAAEDSKNEKTRQLQYELESNPEYMANKRQNIIMICAAGLLGLAIIAKR